MSRDPRKKTLRHVQQPSIFRIYVAEFVTSRERRWPMSSTTLMPAASVRVIEAVRVRPAYSGLAAVKACSAPTSAAHGTTVSAAAFRNGTAVTDLAAAQDVPGSPPREAPV